MKNIGEIAQQILNLIAAHEVIIIHRHVNPDGDAMGSQWGLKQIIDDNFANKKVLVPGDINEQMSKFYPEPDEVRPEEYQNALVIICDTANRERISGASWNLAKTIVKIDHHPEIDQYATINFVDSKVPAVCQLVAKWAQLLQLKLSQDAARMLFLGLVTDSGRFLYRNVNSETFAIAAYLTKTGFDILDLYDNLYMQNFKTMLIKGYILNRFKVSKYGVGHLICTTQQLLRLAKKINLERAKKSNLLVPNDVKLTREDLTMQVNLMANIEGIKIWFIACEDDTDQGYKVSVRSSRIVINKTLSKFAGGGHELAAGCYLSKYSQVKKLLQELDQVASNEAKN